MDEQQTLADKVFIVDRGRVAISGTVRSSQVWRKSGERVPQPHQCQGSLVTALDLSPAPAPAPPAQRIIRHGLIEARLLMRNAERCSWHW